MNKSHNLYPTRDEQHIYASEHFGMRVFTRDIMQKMLPPEIYKNLVAAYDGLEPIHPDHADTIAVAMKEWAISHGATHYTHWFHPLTGASAEKHDSFIEWNTPDQVIEKFTGKQLLQGEPDASSFPSGGLRSTYEARGYTGWDPTSPAFVWKGGDGTTLCIPSVFYSWTGDVLDTKIPLLRSDAKLNKAVMRLLKLSGIPASNVHTTIGLEQEYFIIDRKLRDERVDLKLSGRTVFGAPSPKGQELQDHYFGSVKDRILSFMHEFETKALQLAIPVKTRHNEVAPAQHEVAPVYEKASRAVDHNILLMELMRKTAIDHKLACLLHEKPFQGLNGSGKHCNWSVVTDTGINLLDPTDTPENNFHFLVIMTAILSAIYEHPALLRASIGSYSNDFRLGGHEAPPAIISVFLGEELENFLENIEKTGSHQSRGKKKKLNLDVLVIPELPQDNTDRNRTSPFAFTGNKFEFRALGSSIDPAMPVTVLNTIVTESLTRILDEIEKNLGKGEGFSEKQLAEAAIPVLQKYLKMSRDIRFNGDNYSEEWVKIAAKRKLPNIKKSVTAFETLLDKKTIHVFEGILKENELKSRYEILMERYIQMMEIDVNLTIDIFRTKIFPAAVKTQKNLAKSIGQAQNIIKEGGALQHQITELQRLSIAIESALKHVNDLERVRHDSTSISDIKKKGILFVEKVFPRMEELRHVVDYLEGLVDDTEWPIPKYSKLLFDI